MGHGSSSQDESWLVLSGARRGLITKASLLFDLTTETNQTQRHFTCFASDQKYYHIIGLIWSHNFPPLASSEMLLEPSE